MSTLQIRLKRHPDDSASITCTRADGSVTWQRQSGKLGMVFPPHDLTHYAVESVLGCTQAFYGLLARGWEISDFAKPWPRGPVPAEAIEVEILVGCFDAQRRDAFSTGNRRWNAEEFRAHCTQYVGAQRAAKHQDIAMPRELSQAQLDEICDVRDALLRRWFDVGAKDDMMLTFPAGDIPPGEKNPE